MPSKSTEFPAGSPKYDEYLAALNAVSIEINETLI
jgi:hypothetical protein